MPDDDELRDMVLDLHAQRESERAAHRECRTVSAVLEALSGAKTVAETRAALVATVKERLGADLVLLFEDGTDAMLLLDPVPAGIALHRVSLAPGLFDKARNLADLGQVPGTCAGLGALLGDAYRSLLSAPVPADPGPTLAIAAFRRDRAAFTTDERRILQRIARHAGQALQAQGRAAHNRLLAAAIDGSPFGFTISDATDPDRPLIFANPAFERISGYRAKEVHGRSSGALFSILGGEEIPAELCCAMSHNGEGSFVLKNRRKNGTEYWNALTLFPVPGADGEAEYLVATQWDVSERIRAERESEEARRRMDEALSHTRDAFLLLSRRRRVLFANPTVNALFPAPNVRWVAGTTFAANWADHIATVPASLRPLTETLSRADLEKLAGSGAGREMRLADGRIVLVRAARTSDGGMVISATDVTPLKTAERMLRQRMEAIDSAADGIGITDEDGRLVQANPSLTALFGARSETALIGRPWWRAYQDENDREVLRVLEAELRRSGKSTAQLACSDGDGTRTHEVSLSAAENVGRILIVRDVTRELDARRRRQELADQLDQARRQQVLSELAARMAHDFGNLLSAITGSADLIEAEKADPEKVSRHAARILAAGAQAIDLVDRLMDVGRGQRGVTRFDLRKAVEDAVDLARTGLRRSTTLWTDFARHKMPVKGSMTEVGQIVVNLILNAEDALERAPGEIAVSLMIAPGRSRAPVMAGALTPERSYAVLSVRDTGCGILPELRSKIFEPYFTTKGDKGTGLGLASIAQLVTRIGGAVAVETAPGNGSTFRVFWPLVDAGTAKAEPKVPGARVLPENAERLEGALILLVDDDTRVTDILETYLERLGAEVATVDAADLAIEAVREDPGAWAAVVTDYDMGAMTGGDVAGAMADMAPDVPVFVISAMTRRLSDPRIAAANVRGVFAKPVDLRQVAVAISQGIAGAVNGRSGGPGSGHGRDAGDGAAAGPFVRAANGAAGREASS